MKKEIVNINKNLGGQLVRSNSLDWACYKAKEEKNVFRKNAFLIRAIVVDHPFNDMNKSSATIIAKRNFDRAKIQVKNDSLLNSIKKVAKNNITDINQITRILRRCSQKKK